MPMTNGFAKVRAFHIAFGHPAPDPMIVSVQPADRVKARARWIDSEADEFEAATTIVDQADGLIDAMYFGYGGLVELGVDPGTHFDGGRIGSTQALLTPADVATIRAAFFTQTATLPLATTRVAQTRPYCAVISIAMESLNQLGLDPGPLFDIVHAANMAKLWPDGTAHKGADGKVIKPPQWVAPEPALKVEVERQMAAAR